MKKWKNNQDIDSFLLIINDNSMMIGLSGRKNGMQKITIIITE